MKAFFGSLAVLLLVSAAAHAQYPQHYVGSGSPYNYPGPSAPVRLGPQTFVGSSYGFTQPGTSCYPPPTTYYPVYSSFYDPRAVGPRYADPGPYWYTRTYPFTSSYYSYYYTPGYFRY